MQRVLLNNDLAVDINVQIGQVGRQQGIVVAEAEAQQQRLATVHRKLQVRKKAGIVMKKAVWAAGRYPDVAVAVQHRKGVTVFERAASPCREFRRGDMKRRLENRIYFGCRCRRDTIN